MKNIKDEHDDTDIVVMDSNIAKKIIELTKAVEAEESYESGVSFDVQAIKTVEDVCSLYKVVGSRELSPLELRDWIFCGTLGSLAGISDAIKSGVNGKLTQPELAERLDNIQKK